MIRIRISMIQMFPLVTASTLSIHCFCRTLTLLRPALLAMQKSLHMLLLPWSNLAEYPHFTCSISHCSKILQCYSKISMCLVTAYLTYLISKICSPIFNYTFSIYSSLVLCQLNITHKNKYLFHLLQCHYIRMRFLTPTLG